MEVDQYKKEKNRLLVTMNVEGMMHYIRRSMTTKDQQDLLDEYAKLYILKALGIKTTPEEID